MIFIKGYIPWNKNLKGCKKATSGSFKKGHQLWKGRKHTEETRKKMRKNHADFSGEKHPRYKNGFPHCLDCGKTLTWYRIKRCQDCWFKSRASTSIEKAVYDYLLLKGVLFEKQKLINGKFIVDAYIPSLNLVIEADGTYWHNRKECKNKDKAENAYLKKCGFNLLRLSEDEIKSGKFKERMVF